MSTFTKTKCYLEKGSLGVKTRMANDAFSSCPPDCRDSLHLVRSSLSWDLDKVDINGDGMMEWDEFTRFVVAKAQLHHAQMNLDQIGEYRQGPRQVSALSPPYPLLTTATHD